MAASLEHKNQEASMCAPEKCHLLLCKGCALHGERPRAPSFLRRASREAPPAGRSVPPACVPHSGSVTGRQAGRREARSVLGAQGVSRLPRHSIPSCHVQCRELGAAGPDVQLGWRRRGQGGCGLGWKPSGRWGPGVSETAGEAARRQLPPKGSLSVGSLV